MKKKITALWILFIVCVCITIGLWFMVNKSNPKYEEVQVTVLSAETKKVKNRKTGSTYTSYEIKVSYEGKTYDLENAHNAYSYLEGRQAKAYLYKNRLFANVEGVKNATSAGTLYFVFLIGSFILFFVTLIDTSKYLQNKKEEAK